MFKPRDRVTLLITMRDKSQHRIPGVVVAEPRPGTFERRNAPSNARPVPTSLVEVISFWDLPANPALRQPGRTFYKHGEQPIGFLVPRFNFVPGLDDLVDSDSQNPFGRLYEKVEQSILDLQSQRRDAQMGEPATGAPSTRAKAAAKEQHATL